MSFGFYYLKFLVHPEYSGQAIMELSIFEEFISLCYTRMGMTEAAGIQIDLIDMFPIFATTQQHSGSTGLDVLLLTSPLRIVCGSSSSCASSTRKLRSLITYLYTFFILFYFGYIFFGNANLQIRVMAI